MTIRKRFVVRRGDKISIGLPVESGAERARTSQRGDEDSKLVYPGDEEDDLYVFRNGIPIFNLGMKLIDAPHKTYQGISLFHSVTRASWTNYDFTSLDSFFLATVPLLLDHAFQSTQGIPNRKPIVKDVERRYTDLIITKEDDSTLRSALGKLNRPFIDQIGIPSAPNANTNELWQHSRLAVAIRKAKALRLDSISYFYDFDTADTTHFKITNDPVYTADEVPVILNKLTAIYLVPLIVPYTYSYNFRVDTAPDTTSTMLGFGPLMSVPFADITNVLIGTSNATPIGAGFVLFDQIQVQANSNAITYADPSEFPGITSAAVGDVVIRIINQQTGAVTVTGFTGGVPISPGSAFWEFPEATEIVDPIPGLTLTLAKFFNPTSPFADIHGNVKTWVNANTAGGHYMAVGNSVVGYIGGGSSGPGFPILAGVSTMLVDVIPQDDPMDIVFRGSAVTTLTPEQKALLFNRFLAEIGSGIADNETIAFDDIQAHYYLSFPRPFTRNAVRDEGFFSVGTFTHPRTGMLVAALKSGSSIQYVWIKEPFDDQDHGEFVNFPQATGGIVTGRVEDGSRTI